MFTRILLSVDMDNADDRRAIDLAAAMARSFGAELHVVAVLPDFGMSIVGSYFEDGYEARALGEIGERLTALVNAAFAEDITVHPHVLKGRIYNEIVAAADRLSCDAIIVSAHDASLSDHILGPNAERVVRNARQSVFVVRD